MTMEEFLLAVAKVSFAFAAAGLITLAIERLWEWIESDPRAHVSPIPPLPTRYDHLVKAHAELTVRLGREPSPGELWREVGW